MRSTETQQHGRRRSRSRGQVAVIFGGAMFLFILLSAVVVDISWYWSSNLKMQRAADSAALAGVVYLPGDVSGAYTTARNEAAKNGYSAAGGYTVTPVQDPFNTRRLNVTISGNIGTFFARVAGITSFPASRASKADFVLPVPMGSPQNYYGVGFYEGRVAKTTLVPGNTATDTGGSPWNATSTSTAGGQWSTPNNAFANDNKYTTQATSGQKQIWQDFNLQGEIPNDATLVIDGLEVALTDVSLTGSGTMTDCRVTVETTWNGGTNWSSPVQTTALGTNANDDRTVGSNSSTSMWSARTWTRADFANGSFRVRLTWTDGTSGCAASRDVRLDLLEVRVQFHTSTTSFVDQVLSVNDPLTGAPLAPQGFWGAIFTSGGIRENGDRYAPANLGGGAVDAPGPGNPNYDPGGYDYTIELPGGSGQVRLFDPIFCATGPNSTGGSFGAGDHWTGVQGAVNRHDPWPSRTRCTTRRARLRIRPTMVPPSGHSCMTLAHKPWPTSAAHSVRHRVRIVVDRHTRTARPTRRTTNGSRSAMP